MEYKTWIWARRLADEQRSSPTKKYWEGNRIKTEVGHLGHNLALWVGPKYGWGWGKSPLRSWGVHSPVSQLVGTMGNEGLGGSYGGTKRLRSDECFQHIFGFPLWIIHLKNLRGSRVIKHDLPQVADTGENDTNALIWSSCKCVFLNSSKGSWTKLFKTILWLMKFNPIKKLKKKKKRETEKTM